MSDPWIEDYVPVHISSDYNVNNPREVWDFITHYRFQCYLLLDDDAKTLLTKIVLTDTNEVWQVRNRATLRSYAPPPPSRVAFRRVVGADPVLVDLANYTQIYNNNRSGQAGETPFSYINANKESLDPATKDMLAVIDEKIRSL
jgi:hypothetical protein